MTSTRQQAAELYHQLYLEVEHLKADIEYEDATSYCVDCPASERAREFSLYLAEYCCKESAHWRQDDFKHIEFCQQLMNQLKTLAGDEEIAAAQAKVAQK